MKVFIQRDIIYSVPRCFKWVAPGYCHPDDSIPGLYRVNFTHTKQRGAIYFFTTP